MLLLSVTIMSSLLCFDVFAEYAWEKRVDKDSGKYVWYYKSKGPLKSHWVKEAGYLYYVESDGKLRTEPFDSYVFNTDENAEIPYGALIEKNQVLTKEKKGSDFTYLEVKREEFVNYDKIIVMLHGLSGNKIDYRYHASEAAAHNVLVLVPEIYGHENNSIADIEQMVKVTSNHINELLKLYKTREDIEVDILGCSLGGVIGSYYTTHGDYKVSKLGMLISTLNLQSLTHEIFQFRYKNGREYEGITLSDLQCCLNNISDNYNFKDTRVQMYNTLNDPYMPYDKTRVRVKNLEQHVMKYSGHTITENEFHEVIDWLVANDEV